MQNHKSSITDKGEQTLREGLYVTLKPKGIIKKHLSTIFGEVQMDDITISEELIQFSEKVIPFNIEKDPQDLWNKVQEIETELHPIC